MQIEPTARIVVSGAICPALVRDNFMRGLDQPFFSCFSHNVSFVRPGLAQPLLYELDRVRIDRRDKTGFSINGICFAAGGSTLYMRPSAGCATESVLAP
jgi:hypothetical protein